MTDKLLEIVDEETIMEQAKLAKEEMLKAKEPEVEKIFKQVRVSPLPMIEVTELPSGFKDYPEGTQIFYTPIQLKELEALNSGTLDYKRGMEFLLQNIHCNKLEAQDLAYFDIVYIGVLRKLQAFGNVKGQIGGYCPVCGEYNTHDFEYTEIEFDMLDDSVELPAVITIGGKELEFGLATFKDVEEINTDEGVAGVYAHMVKNLPYEEAYQLISTAYGDEILMIHAVEEALTYGIKPFEVNCKGTVKGTKTDKKGNKKEVDTQCGQLLKLEIKSPFEVVFPSNITLNDYKSKIQFGRR